MLKRAVVSIGRKGDEAVAAVRALARSVIANYGQSLLIEAEDQDLLAIAEAGYRVRELPDTTKVQLGAFQIDANSQEVRSTSAAPLAEALPTGQIHLILGLVGPIHPDWKSELTRLGVVFHEAIDEFHYLISATTDKVDDIQGLDFVESVNPYHPALKVNETLLTEVVERAIPRPGAIRVTPMEAPARPTPSLDQQISRVHPGPAFNAEEQGNLELRLFDPADLVRVADLVRGLGARVIRAEGDRLVVFADQSLIPGLAAIPQIREVNPFRPRKLHNNVATGIINVDTLHNDHGLDGSGQIVGVGDTGLDNGNNDATMLDDFEGRIVSLYALGRVGDASDPNGHGTHVAGSVLGDGSSSSGNIRGMAPAAQQVFLSIMDSTGGLGGLPSNLGVGYFDVSRDDGARIHTNSWGADVNGAYTTDSTNTDTFAFNNREFLIVFSAGNDAPNRVGAPGTAKNPLTVGASESLRALPAAVNFPSSPRFPSGVTANNLNQQADNQNHVAAFSSVGPAQNNRRKPDVVAPGTWILSTRSSVAVEDAGPDGLGPAELPANVIDTWPTAGTGDEDGVPTHAEAVGLGLPGGPIFGGGDVSAPAVPPGSGAAAPDNYMYLGGTSMATPITTGACALVRQYLVQQRDHTPSGTLIKAIMVNGAVDMGLGVPHNGQGWGRIDLDNALFPPGTGRVQFDDTLDNAVATGDTRSYDVHVAPGPGALAVTLAWRDRAGSTIQNRLYLRVTQTATATTFTSDPIGDIRNNVQKVIVPAAAAGNYQIEVEGVSVGMGVPELAGSRQDYALVVSNATGFSCNPSDIVQVIDRSGSMGFFGYMERAKQMIDILQINDRAGVVSFSSAATEDFPLTLIDSHEDKEDAHNEIDPLVSSGLTDLRESLERGLTTLGADAGRPRAVVFLSDGHHTVATPSIDNAFLATLVAANVKVYTIGLGPDSDYGVLNNIASQTGTGAVYTVESEADLHKLHEIYYDIIGGIGCGGVIHLNSAALTPQNLLTTQVNIDATTREAHFAASWDQTGVEVDLILQDPGGNTLTSGSPEVFSFRSSTHQFFRVSRPAAGLWRMIVRHRGGGNAPVRATTAALADTDVSCRARLDPQFLIRDQILVSLEARLGGKPLTGGKAFALITYPKRSIDDLLRQYAEELKQIPVDQDRLRGDTGDPDRLRLGLLSARLGAQGKDIFERETVRLELTDDGHREDPKPNDGVYTGFFDPKRAGVAGNFEVRVHFEVSNPSLGTHTCTKILPVFVPAVSKPRTVIGGIVNAALDADIAPAAARSLISIFGSGFAADTKIGEAPGGKLNTALAGAEVLVGGENAPLLYASPEQINAQVPDLPAGSYPVRVTGIHGVSDPEPLNISDTAPGIFVVTKADYSVLTEANPAKENEALILWCTGCGPAELPVAAGELAPPQPLSFTVAKPEVHVGGTRATLISSVLSPGFAGLEQVAVFTPAGLPPGKAEVVLTVGGRKSNAVMISVK